MLRPRGNGSWCTLWRHRASNTGGENMKSCTIQLADLFTISNAKRRAKRAKRANRMSVLSMGWHTEWAYGERGVGEMGC
jgi:hypothetical protein